MVSEIHNSQIVRDIQSFSTLASVLEFCFVCSSLAKLHTYFGWFFVVPGLLSILFFLLLCLLIAGQNRIIACFAECLIVID